MMNLGVTNARRYVWLTVCTVIFAFSSSMSAQVETTSEGVKEDKSQPESTIEKADLVPAIKGLREVTLGMTVEQVKDTLGKPDVEDKTGLFFTPTKTESVQIGLDPKGTVRTIAVIYSEGDKNAPDFEDIFGPKVEKPETKDTVYKMVRYPEAGYWVSFSLSNPGSKPTTRVTMRRLDR